MTAWSCHSTQKYVSEKRGHAQQISSLPTVNKICPWIYSSFQCGINEFWVWVTHGSAHSEVGSWAAFHSHAPRPGSTATGRVPTPFSGQWNFWKILQLFNAGLGKCPEFWLWQCYELLFLSLHWAVTVAQKKSQSSCQDMPHSRVSPRSMLFLQEVGNSTLLFCVCTWSSAYLWRPEDNFRSHSGTRYLVDFYFFLFSRKVLSARCGGTCF